MAEWGIKVSQPNQDVKTCADKDLAFSSQWNSLKIYSRGEGQIEVPAYSVSELIINHNLGYCPFSFVIVRVDSNWFYSPGYFWEDMSRQSLWYHYTTNSQLIVGLNNLSSNYLISQFKYLILIEESA